MLLTQELLSRYDVPGPRYTSYPTANVWTDSVGAADLESALKLSHGVKNEPMSLYVHLPFCRSLCSYCACNVVIARTTEKVNPYIDCIARELDIIVELIGRKPQLSQLHWGGGTPTFLDERQTSRLCEIVSSRFDICHEAEISIEVDPAATSNSHLEQLKALGFNRISVGVQDLDPVVLMSVRRQQAMADVVRVVNHARILGFQGVNFDLIYGLPYQTSQSWANTIEDVINMSPDRLAIYSMAYLPDARRNQKILPVGAMPFGFAKMSLFVDASERLVGQGYRPIGMDHFVRHDDPLSRAKDEGRLQRNFQGYSVRCATNTLGVGASSITYCNGLYTQNERSSTRYMKSILEGKLPTVRGWRCSHEDRRRAKFISELMCHHRVVMNGQCDDFRAEIESLKQMVEDGLVVIDDDEIRLTELGVLFLRNVAMVFDAYLQAGDNTFSRTV